MAADDNPSRSEHATTVIAAFLRVHPGLGLPSGATSQCRIATAELVEYLHAAGFEASAVWVRGHRKSPRGASATALAADRHLVVRLGPSFVDVTRQQFEEAAPHPRWYESEQALAEHWRELDDGPTDGRLEDERWRTLTLPARSR